MKKPLSSYSSVTKYKTCPQLYDYLYVKKVRSKEMGASLAFGTAVDVALGFLLQSKKDGKEAAALLTFKDMFLSDRKGWNHAFDDSSIRYRLADYDADVLSSVDDTTLLTTWEEELKVKKDEAIKAEKQKEHKPFNGTKLKMFNRMCWLSLKRKGLMMLDAFVKEVLPKIKKVIAVQQRIEGEVGDVADAGGYIDLICEYEGFLKPVVFDIKTSASFYESDSVIFSEQLHLYLSVVSDEIESNLAGYIVLLKIMRKKLICSSCQYKKDGKHKKCNNIVNGARCNGKWSGIPEGQTQTIVNEISKEKQEEAIRSFTNATIHATQNLPFKDYDSCFKYGLCEMFHLCHYGDKSKYTFPEDRKLKTLPVINNTPKEEASEPK